MWKQLFQVKACAFVSELVFQVDDGASSVVVPLVRPDVRLVLSFGLQGLPVGRATLRKTCRNVLSIDDVALCVCMCARRTSLMMSIKGRSFGCSEEAELKICCPGFGGPTATSVPRSRAAAEEFALGGNGTCNCQPMLTPVHDESMLPHRFHSLVCPCVRRALQEAPARTAKRVDTAPPATLVLRRGPSATWVRSQCLFPPTKDSKERRSHGGFRCCLTACPLLRDV
ncbi:stabilin-2 isoform X2 [Phycodurus eques]|uniref:stabilin-2 isoform X2 n=1 Tax=Phycodurus eques TaxID=693459 RepID=UPI002ACEC487|nr:stabilin-2 isoform X2 [Phycodurus eques]